MPRALPRDARLPARWPCPGAKLVPCSSERTIRAFLRRLSRTDGRCHSLRDELGESMALPLPLLERATENGTTFALTRHVTPGARLLPVVADRMPSRAPGPG